MSEMNSEKSFPTSPPLGKDPTYTLSAKKLEGKIAIITGGAKGIGEATVRLFAWHGAKVVIADVDHVMGLALANKLSPSVTYIRCDVSSEEDVKNVIDSTVSRYGKLDIIFNNAGFLRRQSKHISIVDFDADEFDILMRVNARGVAMGMKHAARVMIPKRTGCIISTSSVAGVMGGTAPHAYTASKHAIVGLTNNTACELGKYGIRVNCISPFGVATSMMSRRKQEDNEDKREKNGLPCEQELEEIEEFVRSLGNLKNVTLKPSDIAEAALYLASDESRYVSGHNLLVDGGVTTTRNYIGF